MRRLRTAILISGRGSNMGALVAASHQPGYPAEIVGVLSNKADAPGLDFARAEGLPTAVVSHRDHQDRAGFDAAMHDTLIGWEAELVCLAGFMRLLTPGFVEAWQGRMINIHPSLLPRHKGLDTHARALAAGDTETGCTVHFVTAGMDEGPVLAQARVPILPGDTAGTLAARVLLEEHRLYPEALADLARQRAAALA